LTAVNVYFTGFPSDVFDILVTADAIDSAVLSCFALYVSIESSAFAPVFRDLAVGIDLRAIIWTEALGIDV
jgi:hypothetical protein